MSEQPMSDEDLAAIETRCENLPRTGQPLEIVDLDGQTWGWGLFDTYGGLTAQVGLHDVAVFFLHAREDAPRLLAEVRRLRAIVGKR